MGTRKKSVVRTIIIGERFGKWTVIGAEQSRKTVKYCKVECDCGTISIVRFARLYSGDSLGCQPCCCIGNKNGVTHGYSKKSEYRIWIEIKSRCFNPKKPEYHYYGGRGITMHGPWIHDFISFYNHIGPRPSLKYSVDRINNNGNYEPGNIRWATREEQVNNTRSNVVMTIDNTNYTFMQACNKFDLKVGRVNWYRRSKNLSPYDAIQYCINLDKNKK